MAKIVTFGEIMLHLAPKGSLRFVQADRFQAAYGGEEANVAISLANYGHNVNFVSKLPKNEIGQAAINGLRRYGVDTANVARGGERIGLYYSEKGVSTRPPKVIYDRAGSAFSAAAATDFKWDKIFDGMRWFHFSGVTPALGPAVAECCEEACKAAKAKGVVISCDLRYRKSMWTPEEAGEVMGRLCEYADIGIANAEDVKDVFGIAPKEAAGEITPQDYKDMAKQMAERFKFSKTAITLRVPNAAGGSDWSAMLYDSGKYLFSKSHAMPIFDQEGGDSFAAGVIHSVLGGTAPQTTVDFSVAAARLKCDIEGDYNLASAEEVRALMKADTQGKTQK